MMHIGVRPDLNVSPLPPQPETVSKTKAVLEELFVLLEEYGPVWYTQEHHDRAVKALLDRED